MSPWIALIGTVAGVLLGGGIAWLNARFQLSREEQRERKRLFLTKLEELYERVSQFRLAYRVLTLEQTKLLEGREPLEKRDGPPPVERLQMLVGFYTPDLSAYLERLLKVRENYAALLVNHSIGHERKGDAEIHTFLAQLLLLDRKLSLACDDLKEQIVRLSKNYL